MQGEIFNFLVVEDDPQHVSKIADIIKKHLGNATRVKIAATIKDALELHEKFYFDGYFVDLNLPDGKGGEFIHRIRRTKPRHPIVVVSIDRGLEIKVELLQGLKIQGYLEKDYKDQAVIDELDRMAEVACELDDTELTFRDDTGIERIKIRNVVFVRMKPNTKQANIGIYDFHLQAFRMANFRVESLASVLKMCHRKNSLIQCQKGSLVNPNFIKRYEIEDEQLMLHYTEVKLPVGGGQFRRNIKPYIYG